MNTLGLTVVATGFLLYSLVARRLDGLPLTAPMIFAAFGLVIGPVGLAITNVDADHSILQLVAQLTLILVLFADASRINVRQLLPDHNLPLRMLLLGLPLSIVAGTAAAVVLFPEFGLWEAALLAALLAPTDAALGQSVIDNTAVSPRVRQAINVESGLNDGLALPAVLLFAALAGSGQGAGEPGQWLRFGVLQVVLGPIVGIAAGALGARLANTAVARQWATAVSSGIYTLSLAAFSYFFAELIGGNGFISAFFAGMTLGTLVKGRLDFLARFIEGEGQLLMLTAFLVFGMSLLPESLALMRVDYVLYAVLSLTVIRMLPVAVSLAGCGLRSSTVLFLGWFGPRGLASILYILLILKSANIPHQSEIVSIVVITVALSIVLHGVTASPLARAYARSVGSEGAHPEARQVSHIPWR